MNPSAAVRSSGRVSFAPANPSDDFPNTVHAIARIAFMVIGTIFAAIAITGMVVDLAIPSPLLLLIGGVAFVVLGLVMPPRHAPLPQEHRRDPPPSVHDRDRLREAAPAQEELEAASSDSAICCARQHFLVSNEQQVDQIAAKNLEAAAHQLNILEEFPRNPRRQALKFLKIDMVWNLSGYTSASCMSVVENSSDYALLAGRDKISFEYNQRKFKAALIAAFNGELVPEDPTRDYIVENLGEYIEYSIKNHSPLTHGYFNALSTAFDHLNGDLLYLKAPPLSALLTVLFLREHVWMANLGENRVMLFQKDSYAQLSCCTAVQPSFAAPAITRYRINDVEGHLIIGSPAFWKAISPSSIQKFINEKKRCSPQDILYMLINHAYTNGCRSPLAATIVKITPQGIRADQDCDALSDAGSVPGSARRPFVNATDDHF